MAALKANKKIFETQRLITAEQDHFKTKNQVLGYSWNLFKNRQNQRDARLSDMGDPVVKFNMNKFYEFRYGTK